MIAMTFPKIELHCHLDGSLRPETLWQWARSDGHIPADLSLDQFLPRVQVPADCPDLRTYLQCFQLPCACLNSRERFAQAAEELLGDAVADQVIYLEMRYAPHLHRQALSPEASIEGILEGIKRAQQKWPIQSGLLLCALRGLDEAWPDQLRLLELAQAYRDDGVLGIDLAGDEVRYPLARYERFFTEARRREIPFTIHAGECGDPQNVAVAVHWGATRLGHGLATARDPQLQALCSRHQVLCEMCPTSNLQTKNWQDYADYPFADLVAAGIPACLNTDNRTVSMTTVSQEYAHLAHQFKPHPMDYVLERQREAVKHCFAQPSVQQNLMDQLSAAD